MADYDGNALETFDRIQVTTAIWAPNNAPGGDLVVEEYATPSVGGAQNTNDPGLPEVIFDFDGDTAGGYDLFYLERIWAVPGRIDLGNILTTITREVEIYNAFRETNKSLTAVTANAGPGVMLSDVPSLPATLVAQSGTLFDVVASTDGPPSIDGTINVTVSGESLSIPITGNRVIILPYEPESPIRETLEFLTDVLRATNGKEQRIALRKNPRQRLRYKFSMDEDSAQSRTLNTRIFGAQAALFGLPMWFERARLTSAASATDTTIDVDTRYADFRVGGVAIVWSDDQTFDALVIDSKTDSTITFSSGIVNNYPVGAFVMPMRTARTNDTVQRVKANVNLEEVTFDFLVSDNDANLADTSAFASFNSKVLLEDLNISNGDVSEDFNRRIYVIDSLAGAISQSTQWNGPAILSRIQ